MLSVKTRIKIKNSKIKMVEMWYKLMKPLAYIVQKIDNTPYYIRQRRINKWTDEYVIKVYAKELVKKMINAHPYTKEYEFVVASWSNEDYGIKTIRNYMECHKNISEWSFTNIPMIDDISKIRRLTELLKLELQKYKEITTEYIVEEDMYDWKVKNYEKTLVVKLNLNI